MNEGKPICVLGVMTNERGLMIAKQMREWLIPYDVHDVLHDGTQFEYPALKEAKRLACLYNAPVLYLHTRGAVNVYTTTAQTHKMWRREFGEQWRKYQLLVKTDRPAVFAPFVDWDSYTRYNGFIANAAAWKRAKIEKCDERHEYEHIWDIDPEVDVIGTLIHKPDHAIKEIREYLQVNFG